VVSNTDEAAASSPDPDCGSTGWMAGGVQSHGLFSDSRAISALLPPSCSLIRAAVWAGGMVYCILVAGLASAFEMTSGSPMAFAPLVPNHGEAAAASLIFEGRRGCDGLCGSTGRYGRTMMFEECLWALGPVDCRSVGCLAVCFAFLTRPGSYSALVVWELGCRPLLFAVLVERWCAFRPSGLRLLSVLLPHHLLPSPI